MKQKITKSQLLYACSLLNNCIDEYIYIFNIADDTCIISEKAAEQFNLPSGEFGNAAVEILKVIYPDDRAAYLKELDGIRSGRRTELLVNCRWVNRSGEQISVTDKARLMPDDAGAMILLMGRISFAPAAKTAEKDALTGFSKITACEHEYEDARKQTGFVSGFILKVDIDNLGEINEHLGREAGDIVLKVAADCARRSCPKQVHLYRDSNDEFIFLDLSGGNGIDARHIYSDMKHCITEAEQGIDYKVIFTISGSVVAFFDEKSSFADVMQKVNYTMQSAKSHGKNALSTFSAAQYAKHLKKLTLQEQLRISVMNGFEGFELYYQPVVDARELLGDKGDSKRISVVGAEALLRWKHPVFGLLGAGDIIPILEECGLIVPVGRWILMSAFQQCSIWNKYRKSFRMSVNLSYIQIEKSDLLLDVQIALDKTKVNPANIVLEITESGYIDNEELHHLLDELTKMHIKIDIDDFGTGYSNMRYLQDLHANTLKLDYTIIHKAVTSEHNDMIIVEYITRMAHELGMNVCMEGIETPQDVQKLVSMKPDKYQGFLFGKPVDARTFVDDNLGRENCPRTGNRGRT